jgi:hypothetical protein
MTYVKWRHVIYDLSFQNISENDLKTFGAKSIGIMLHDNKFIKELNIAGS